MNSDVMCHRGRYVGIIKITELGTMGTRFMYFGDFVFTWASTAIQQHENSRKERDNTALNQQVLDLAKDNYRLSRDIREENEKHFEATVAPDLRIDGGKIQGNNYQVSIANHGQRTAEDIQLEWNYSYATQIVSEQRELPPGKTCMFESEIFPSASHSAMHEAYRETQDRFRRSELALIVRLKVSWSWNGRTDTSREYTLIWDGKKLLLY